MTRISASALLVFSLLAASPASATWPNAPKTDVRICGVYGNQLKPVSISDGAGGAIFAWTDQRSLTYMDVYAQRIGADGKVLWTADGVAVCTALYDQDEPALVSDGAGGAIIAWHDARSMNYDIYAQRVSAAGAMLWATDGVPLCAASGEQSVPAIVSDGAGGAIVTWQDMRTAYEDVYAQRVDATGAVQWTANGVAVVTAPWQQTNPAIAPDGKGGAILAWEDARGSNWHIYAQQLDHSGVAQWTTNGVAVCTAAISQSDPVVVSDGVGGAIISWRNVSSGGTWIYAQRLNGSGVAAWTADGVALSGAAGVELRPCIATDGASGAIVAWRDTRNGNYDVYAQRISASGAVQWAADGAALCTAAGDQGCWSIVSDGTGGAIVTWDDARRVTWSDIYAQRVDAAGATQWTSGGVPISTADTNKWWPVIAGDLAGGAIIAWQHALSGNDVYAKHVDRWGTLGAQPTITGVHDVPADDGGQVLVSWTRSPLDTLPTLPITSYHLWRQAPRRAAEAALAAGARLLADGVSPGGSPGRLFRTGALGGLTYYWEHVGSVTPTGTATYSAGVATAGDSTGTGNPRTLFMVEAATSTAGQRWVSEPDSGYSVDNLPPAPPAAFRGAYANGTVSLSWDASPATDLAGYRLHRGGTAEFVPGEGNLVATPEGTGYVDAASSPCFYKLAAVDLHGNVSAYAFLQPSGTADAPGAAPPRELALSAPAPNPLRGSSTMRLALPREARVTLAVFDQQGRRVRTLLAGALPAGEHPVTWDGRDDGGRGVANGIYFVRGEAEGRTFTRRIAAVR
jgi:hypothetical protein